MATEGDAAYDAKENTISNRRKKQGYCLRGAGHAWMRWRQEEKATLLPLYAHLPREEVQGGKGDGASVMEDRPGVEAGRSDGPWVEGVGRH